MKRHIAALIVIWTLTATANVSPHHGTLSSINLGARYSSILQNRGVIQYRDFQLDPVVAFFFFDDKLEFLGDSIGYRDFIFNDQIRLRSRIVSISANPLFPNYESSHAATPERPDTYEWSNRLEIFLPGYSDRYMAEIDLGIAKDLSAHHGTYFDLQAKYKLFDFQALPTKIKIEPNLFAAAGWGDLDHNRYFYGPTADAEGLNNFSYGLWFAFPDEADRFYPIIQVTHFETLGTNRMAQYAQNNSDGWLVSFIATYGVLE